MKRTISVMLVLLLLLALAATAFAATASGDTLVYRTGSGKKYHTMTCSMLNGKDSVELTLAEAVAAGLEPCSKCNPPTLETEGTSSSAAASASTVAAPPAAQNSKTSGGFLNGVSPVLTFFIGLVVGALAITYVRGRILMKQDAAEAAAAAEAEAEEPEEK